MALLAAVLITVLTRPVFRVYGTAMAPVLSEGDIVFGNETRTPKRGDVVAFEYHSKVLIRRVIAVGGDVVEQDDSGKLFVNGEKIEETYAGGQNSAGSDAAFPVTVPDNSVFVISGGRGSEVDSRLKEFGYVSCDSIQGRLMFRVWPLNRIGIVK